MSIIANITKLTNYIKQKTNYKREVELSKVQLEELLEEEITIKDLVNNKGFITKLKHEGTIIKVWCENLEYICFANVDDFKMSEFIKLCMLNQEDLKLEMSHLLKKVYGEGKVVETDDYTVASGNTPVTLVAHLDTVFETLNTVEDIKVDGEIITSKYGLGGDDRCGVYMISKLIQRENKPNVILTTNEEIGCLGAQALCNSTDIDLVENSKYLIQLDRRNSNDAVFYQCSNQDFIDYIINEWRFEEREGSCSDISYIAPRLNIAAVNLSSAYYNPHTIDEYVNFKELKSIYDKVSKMIDNLPDKYFNY